jgi:uncharacterized protein YidB (DUF937 family)
MGLLDSVLGQVLGGGTAGGAPSGGNADLLRAVIQMLGNSGGPGGGGIEDLIARFQRGGLGDVIASWISTGHNLPVSADQLREVLGNDTIGALAGQTGASHGDLLGQLAQMLPQVVDHLTPQGRVPEGGLGNVGDLMGALQGALGRR